MVVSCRRIWERNHTIRNGLQEVFFGGHAQRGCRRAKKVLGEDTDSQTWSHEKGGGVCVCVCERESVCVLQLPSAVSITKPSGWSQTIKEKIEMTSDALFYPSTILTMWFSKISWSTFCLNVSVSIAAKNFWNQSHRCGQVFRNEL